MLVARHWIQSGRFMPQQYIWASTDIITIAYKNNTKSQTLFFMNFHDSSLGLLWLHIIIERICYQNDIDTFDDYYKNFC